MELLTINQVSRDYEISARMLRYYEQAGLIESKRKDDYAYRVYDENAIHRLRQIIVLRKLRIPVKQIAHILNNNDAAEAVEIFRQHMVQLDEEITALSTVRSILSRFMKELRDKTNINLSTELLGDEAVLSIIHSLSFSNNQINEVKENVSMDELNKSSEKLNKLEDKDIRIVYLPPMTMAAAIASGEGCEGKAAEMVKKFVNESGLLSIKPDTRSFGFDWSKGAVGIGNPSQSYQVWVSIPDNMEVPAPFVKHTFTGGLYAAHVLKDWDFGLWARLNDWVNTNGKYTNDWGTPRGGDTDVTGQGFEETLNFYNFVQNGGDLQLDLLFPIKVS